MPMVEHPVPATRPRRIPRAGVAVAALGCALGSTLVVTPVPLVVWNVSMSAPPGPYLVGHSNSLVTGDMVIARPPARWRRLAAERRYLPANVPLVKRVAALPGDTVCARGADIRVNRRRVAERRAIDGTGGSMPWWTGCVVLAPDMLFLLMDDPASFDGRYFGPTRRGDIVGEAWPLWRA